MMSNKEIFEKRTLHVCKDAVGRSMSCNLKQKICSRQTTGITTIQMCALGLTRHDAMASVRGNIASLFPILLLKNPFFLLGVQENLLLVFTGRALPHHDKGRASKEVFHR